MASHRGDALHRIIVTPSRGWRSAAAQSKFRAPTDPVSAAAFATTRDGSSGKQPYPRFCFIRHLSRQPCGEPHVTLMAAIALQSVTRLRHRRCDGNRPLARVDPTRLAPSWTFTQPPQLPATLVGFYPTFALLTLRFRSERTCSLLQLSSRSFTCSSPVEDGGGWVGVRALTCCFVRQPCSFPLSGLRTGSREVPLDPIRDERRTACLRLASSEAAGNRTLNPQLKRLLLCQLSYRPRSYKFLTAMRHKNWRESNHAATGGSVLSVCAGSLPHLIIRCQAVNRNRLMLIDAKVRAKHSCNSNFTMNRLNDADRFSRLAHNGECLAPTTDPRAIARPLLEIFDLAP